MLKNFRVKKYFGQNFLVNESIAYNIVAMCGFMQDDVVLEVGPGYGALTNNILDYVKYLHTVEIDSELATYLKNKYQDSIDMHNMSILDFDIGSLGSTVRVIGNLPYNIATKIMFYMSQYDTIVDMHFMLQKELVERIIASCNNKDYGKLTVMMQYKFNCYKILDVTRDNFSPSPKVDSAILKIVPHNKHYSVDQKVLYNIVSVAFNQRRKVISNSLKSFFTKDDLLSCDIILNSRAENLMLQDYIKLANYFVRNSSDI